MKYKDKTKEQHINELAELHRCIKDTVTETAENKVIKTAEVTVSTKNGIKWMIDRDPMSECKEGG
jgi:hypothetical protein